MKHLSLFSGIGGIDLAAHWAGFETIAFVERDPFCQQVLEKNFPGVPIHGDILEFNAKEYENQIEIVSAGFPCQPHSLAGLRKGSGDERDLWSEVVRVLRETKPRWFLGENVPGLLSSERGRFFGRVVNDLAEMGYRVGWGVYGACDIGAVHRRKRVFIVAYSDLFRHGRQLQPEEWEQLGYGWQTQRQSQGYGSDFRESLAPDPEVNEHGGDLFSGLWANASAGDSEPREYVADPEGEPSNVPNARQFLSYRQKQEQFGGGDSKRDATNPTSIRLSGIQEERPDRQDNQEREKGRSGKPTGSGLREQDVADPDCKQFQEQCGAEPIQEEKFALGCGADSRTVRNEYVADSGNESGLQADSSSDSVREERHSWDNASGSHWFPIPGGDWRGWKDSFGVEPIIRRSNDGFSKGMDKPRVNSLKALGNAVVPHQVLPILLELANVSILLSANLNQDDV